MAVDTVKLPGGGKVNRKALVVAGAVGVGVVGYAWVTRHPKEPAPEDIVTKDQLDAVGDERIPTTGVPYDPNTPAPAGGITTNAEWSQFATDRLQSMGYDPIAVGDALGLFLDHRPLSPTQANIARAALSQAGQPPQGGPWSVLTEGPTLPPASVGLPAPAGFKASLIGWRGSTPIYRLSWSPVNGAKDYHLIHVGGSQGFHANTTVDSQGSAPGRVDRWRVAARNAANVVGPYSDLAFTAATKSGAPPATGGSGRPPGAPGSVGVLPTRPGTVGLAWPRTTGAVRYRYRWEGGGRASAWTETTATRVTARWQFPAGTIFTARVQAGNSYGWGGSRTGNHARAL